jgi:hypothetical protein
MEIEILTCRIFRIRETIAIIVDTVVADFILFHLCQYQPPNPSGFFLKPNLVLGVHPRKAITTHRKVMEAIARALDIAIADMAGTDESAGQAIPISKMCTVFAESEVVDRVADGANVSEIVRGVHEMVAGKAATLVRWISKDVLFPVVFSGGVAKNPGVVRALKRSLGGVIVVPEHPQIIGALGAALIACDAP